MTFHENCLLADDSHETSYLIFSKLGKMFRNLSSVAVVIGALSVIIAIFTNIDITIFFLYGYILNFICSP